MEEDDGEIGFLQVHIDALVKAGIDPAKIYAIAMTDGLMPCEENLGNISKLDLEEWEEHRQAFGDHMEIVKKVMAIAKNNPDYRPEHGQYIAAAYFASSVSGIALDTEITDHTDEQRFMYEIAMHIYDKIHSYEMKTHPLEIERRLRLN